MQQIFEISGMHCGACVARVKQALGTLGEVSVTLKPPQAIVISPSPVPLSAVAAALAAAGTYTALPAVIAAPMSASVAAAAMPQATRGFFETYKPLLIIIGLITLVAFASGRTDTGFSWHMAMSAFMAGFFLVFGGFKLFDLKGFATAYASYDLLAARWARWGLIYPFIEIGLGIAYLFELWPFATNLTALVVMGFSSLGVIQALRRGTTIQCACLGTSLNLPMSTVTLVEDGAMVLMAAVMLMWLM